AGALAGGLVLTLCIMVIVLPYQGHGFGYRYIHGLIGSCILLATFGWQSLGQGQGRWRTLLLRATAATVVAVLPLQLWMAHAFYFPAATVSARIDQIAADYVVIGRNDAPFSGDLVHNPP